MSDVQPGMTGVAEPARVTGAVRTGRTGVMAGDARRRTLRTLGQVVRWVLT